MQSKIISKTEDGVKLEVNIKFVKGSMLSSERAIQDALNGVGTLATGELLSRFDTDGTAIIIGDRKYTSKGQVSQKYQTPYGETVVERHVYQSSKGGKTYCPLEKNARIILKSTPRFAEQIGHKAAEMASTQVTKDMEINHQRHVPRSYIKKLSEAVASVLQTKEENWSYHTPEDLKDVKTIAIGLDGTCLLLCENGYRQAMTGTISIYDKQGDKLHTIYVASAPEYGKTRFKARMEQEILHIKKSYSGAEFIGIADGAADNWEFLKNHVDKQILGFYHVTEYLADIAPIVSRRKSEQEEWLNNTCHDLKHKHGAASRILKEIQTWDVKKVSKNLREKLASVITYFINHKMQMIYAKQLANNQPIDSGVTEAACKVIVKQRLCKSGMKWKEKGARFVLSLRTLSYSDGRWEQFWDKVNQYGF